MTATTPPSQSPILRKAVRLAGKPIAQARLYATALGLYELRINGRRVGDHVFAPDWTDYGKRVRYQVYNVTDLVKPGDNALAALLGNGWYCGHVGNGGFQVWGTQPALLAQLEVTYGDGTSERIATDPTWRVAGSPILASDFMWGESYDARQEIAGWDEPGLDDAAWPAATLRKEPPRALDGQVMEPVRVTGTLQPKTLHQPGPEGWTCVMGRPLCKESSG